jgi:hypothetical protein
MMTTVKIKRLTARTAARKLSSKGLRGEIRKKRLSLVEKGDDLEVLGKELRIITKNLIKEGKLASFDKKYVYGNL